MLGISLGKTKEQTLSSILVILELEKEREVIYLKNSLPTRNDDSESSLVLRRAMNLSEDLDEEDTDVFDDHTDLNDTVVEIKQR